MSIFLKVTGLADPARLRVLVVGAGKGHEVLALSRVFPNIKAIEPDYESVAEEAMPSVERGDATGLDFPDESFDLVYCYHVLEHIPEYDSALAEIRRVLKRGGVLYLGVPNKLRIFGYIFNRDSAWRDRIIWNLNDYKARICGKFENRFGAHAGFTAKEISAILARTFPSLNNVTDVYYGAKYGNNFLVRFINGMPLIKNFLWPSIYFVCRK